MAALPLAGCEAGETPEGEVTREARPDGGTLVRYGPLPEEADHVLEPDLRIGALDGEDPEVFGQIRGVEAGPDGTIYVLDQQAREIRVFEADGTFRTVLARGGEGPGEIQGANGLYLDAEGRLWVNDHGKFSFMALDPETGEELAIEPFPVLAVSAAWHGQRDAEGRFWMGTSHDVSGGPPTRPEPGLVEAEARHFKIATDPATGEADSVYVGTHVSRSYGFVTGEMWGVLPIPFEPARSAIADPEGGFWTTPGAPWSVTHLGPDGDTVLVLESSQPRTPVSAEERQRLVDAREQQPAGGMADAMRGALDHAAEAYPSIGHLVLDDEGRLWVERTMERGEPRRYDLFDREGHHLATLDFGFRVANWTQPRIRDGHLYIPAPGESDVPTVVRVPLPEL